MSTDPSEPYLDPADEPGENHMATSGPSLDGSAPFTDWREQLRDRVREIRARKLAGKRFDETNDAPDTEAQAAAARAERLRAPRAHAEPPTEATAPVASALIEGDRAQRRADIEDVVDAFLPPLDVDLTPSVVPNVVLDVAVIDSASPQAALQQAALPEIESPALESAGTESIPVSPPADAPLFEADDEAEALAFDALDDEDEAADDYFEVADDVEEEDEDEDEDEDLVDDDEVVDDEDDDDEDEVVDEDEDEDEDATDYDDEVEAWTDAAIPVGAAPTLDPLASAPAWARAAFGGKPVVGSTTAPSHVAAETPAALQGANIPSWAKPRATPPKPIVDELLAEPPPVARDRTGAMPANPPAPPTARTGMSTPELDFEAMAGYSTPGDELNDLVDDVLGSLAPEASPAPADIHLVGEFRGRVERVGQAPRTALVDPAVVAPAVEVAPRRASLAELFDREPATLNPEPPVPVMADLPAARDTAAAPAMAEAADVRPIATRSRVADDLPRSFSAKKERDEALDWDLATPTDPDTILDAQRDHDPAAPMADRVFSTVADAMVLLTIGVLLVIAGANTVGTALVPFVQATPIPLLAAWLMFALGYGIFFNGTCGQTLGKMAMRVRVIGTERFPVSYGQAAWRAIGYMLATLPAGLGLLPALRDPEHRALHDRLSGTRVVKA